MKKIQIMPFVGKYFLKKHHNQLTLKYLHYHLKISSYHKSVFELIFRIKKYIQRNNIVDFCILKLPYLRFLPYFSI